MVNAFCSQSRLHDADSEIGRTLQTSHSLIRDAHSDVGRPGYVPAPPAQEAEAGAGHQS